MISKRISDDFSAAVRLHDNQATRFQQHYEELGVSSHINIFAYKRLHILEVCDEYITHSKPGLLLDIGCGTGHMLERYSKMGHVPIGCDPSLGMLSQAKGSQRLSNLTQGNGQDLPFLSGSFRTVTCIEVTRWLPKDVEQTTIAEIYRVLSLDGHTLVSFAPSINNRLYNFGYHVSALLRTGHRAKVRQYHHSAKAVEESLFEAVSRTCMWRPAFSAHFRTFKGSFPGKSHEFSNDGNRLTGNLGVCEAFAIYRTCSSWLHGKRDSGQVQSALPKKVVAKPAA